MISILTSWLRPEAHAGRKQFYHSRTRPGRSAMLKELLKNLCTRLTFRAPRRRATPPRRKNHVFRAVLECLEGRTLPSITLSSTHWTPIGPAPMGGPFSGRIDVAAPDPSNPDVMYLGANNGGVWKTTNWLNASPNWTPLTDKPQI